MQTMLKDTLITRVLNETAAGETTLTTTILDMQDFDEVEFEVLLGTVTATAVVTAAVYSNTTSSTTGATAETNATVTLTDVGGASSNGVIIVDLIRPTKRYVYLQITRATANAEINGVMARQYGAKNMPTTQGTGVVASVLAGPNA